MVFITNASLSASPLFAYSCTINQNINSTCFHTKPLCSSESNVENSEALKFMHEPDQLSMRSMVWFDMKSKEITFKKIFIQISC